MVSCLGSVQTFCRVRHLQAQPLNCAIFGLTHEALGVRARRVQSEDNVYQKSCIQLGCGQRPKRRPAETPAICH